MTNIAVEELLWLLFWPCRHEEAEQWSRARETIRNLFPKGKDVSPQKLSPVLWRVCDECVEAEGSLEIDCQLVDCNAGKAIYWDVLCHATNVKHELSIFLGVYDSTIRYTFCSHHQGACTPPDFISVEMWPLHPSRWVFVTFSLMSLLSEPMFWCPALSIRAVSNSISRIGSVRRIINCVSHSMKPLPITAYHHMLHSYRSVSVKWVQLWMNGGLP